MTAPIVIDYAGEPVAKGRGRAATVNGRARVFTPAKTRKAESALAYAASEAMRGRALLDGALAMTLTIRLPVPQSWSKKRQREALAGVIRPTSRPDLDNYLKLIGDACNLVVFRDDSQIVECFSRKVYHDRPGILIVIAPIDAELGAQPPLPMEAA